MALQGGSPRTLRQAVRNAISEGGSEEEIMLHVEEWLRNAFNAQVRKGATPMDVWKGIEKRIGKSSLMKTNPRLLRLPNPRRVRESLKWFDIFIKTPKEKRERLVRSTLKSIRKFSVHGEGHEDTQAGEELASLLGSRMFELVGVSPSVMYAKVKGSASDLKALWVHPFGSPTLLFKHRKLPVLVLTNPGLRYNETMLSEMKFNQDHFKRMVEMTGISG